MNCRSEFRIKIILCIFILLFMYFKVFYFLLDWGEIKDILWEIRMKRELCCWGIVLVVLRVVLFKVYFLEFKK